MLFSIKINFFFYDRGKGSGSRREVPKLNEIKVKTKAPVENV